MGPAWPVRETLPFPTGVNGSEGEAPRPLGRIYRTHKGKQITAVSEGCVWGSQVRIPADKGDRGWADSGPSARAGSTTTCPAATRTPRPHLSSGCGAAGAATREPRVRAGGCAVAAPRGEGAPAGLPGQSTCRVRAPEAGALPSLPLDDPAWAPEKETDENAFEQERWIRSQVPGGRWAPRGHTRSGRGARRTVRAHFPHFQAHRVGNRRGCPDRVETTGKPPELRRRAPPPQGQPDQHALPFTWEPAGPCAEAGRALVSSGAHAPEGDGQYATTRATSSPRRGGSVGAGSPRSGLWYVGRTDP